MIHFLSPVEWENERYR